MPGSRERAAALRTSASVHAALAAPSPVPVPCTRSRSRHVPVGGVLAVPVTGRLRHRYDCGRRVGAAYSSPGRRMQTCADIADSADMCRHMQTCVQCADMQTCRHVCNMQTCRHADMCAMCRHAGRVLSPRPRLCPRLRPSPRLRRRPFWRRSRPERSSSYRRRRLALDEALAAAGDRVPVGPEDAADPGAADGAAAGHRRVTDRRRCGLTQCTGASALRNASKCILRSVFFYGMC